MTMNFTYEVHLVADGKFGTQERVRFMITHSLYFEPLVLFIANYHSDTLIVKLWSRAFKNNTLGFWDSRVTSFTRTKMDVIVQLNLYFTIKLNVVSDGWFNYKVFSDC